MELKMINSNLITIEDLENIQYWDGFNLPQRVFEIFKRTTRNNDFLTYEIAKKKLIRNIMLSYEAPEKVGLKYKRVFYYGCLLIQLNIEERTICYINNNLDIDCKFKLDIEKRKVLNYIMGIED